MPDVMSQQPQSAPDGIADAHPTRVTRYSHWEFGAAGTTHWSMKRPATMAEAAQQEQKEAEALAEKAQRIAQRGPIRRFFAWLTLER